MGGNGEPKLPDNVIQITKLKRERAKGKGCQCIDRKFIVDNVSRKVTCKECGSTVQPYDAIYELAKWMNSKAERPFEQKKEMDKSMPLAVWVWLAIIGILMLVRLLD